MLTDNELTYEVIGGYRRVYNELGFGLIVEIKSCKKLLPDHLKQVLHSVRATDLELALLFNFGPSQEIRRFTMLNGLKKRWRS